MTAERLPTDPGPDTPLARLRALLLDPRAQGALLLACAVLILFARAGAGPLPNYDDAYYAEKAKQMLRTGDWLTPRFAGMERLDNPPLFLWLMAGAFAVMGVTSWAAVFWSALAGVACVGLTHRLSVKLGREPFEAWVAGLVLLATGYFLKYANHAMFDVFLAALFLGAMLAYRRAWEGSARAWLLLGVLTGLGVLTKSALGLFPLIVAALHVLWSGRAVHALRHGAWLAPIAAAAAVAPWYGYQLATHREAFLSEHIAWLLLERGAGNATSAPASEPLGYFRELAMSYWPWLPLALVGLWGAAREAFTKRAQGEPADGWTARDTSRLLIVWLAVVLGIMSLGREKKLWYVMSVYPALALLSANALATLVRRPEARRRVTLAGFALAAAAGAVLALTPWGSVPVRRPDLMHMALAARSMVPESEPIAFLGGNYWTIAHQFVFHSDRTLEPGDGEATSVMRALDSGRWALVAHDRLEELTSISRARYVPVVASGKWALVHVAPAPPVTLDGTRGE